MTSIIFFVDDPFHIILPDITYFIFNETQFPSHSLILNRYTTLIIPFGQFLNSVSASRAFSLLFDYKTAFYALIFIPLYLFLFYSVPFLHIALCASFFPHIVSITSSFQHHAFPLLLLHFSYHTPHHMPLKLHLENLTTNLIYQHQLIQLPFLQIASYILIF